MPSTATSLETRPPGRESDDPKPSMLKSALLVSALLLALTVAGSVWMFVEGARGLRDLVENHQFESRPSRDREVALLVRVMESWLRQVALGTAVGAAGLCVIGAVGFLWWRHRWNARLRTAQKELGWREAECQRLEACVAEHARELTSAVAQRESELDGRRQAERLLAEQTRELERSRNAIEGHVQQRTAELERLRRLYGSILNSAGEGIYGLDLEGRIIFINRAAADMIGAPAEALIGRPEAEVFAEDGATTSPSADGAAERPVMFRRGDGATFPVDCVRTTIEENGQRQGEMVVFKDITERRRAEEALRRKAVELARSNAELEQFAYAASHDLQEPLRKIQAFGDRLRVKCQEILPEDGRDYLGRMQIASARMQTLINDLLTFSRIISTTRPFVPVDLGAVAREVLNDLEVRIEQTRAVVEVDRLPMIQADPLQMRQLLLNLVGNALKFQPLGQTPRVQIRGTVTRGLLGRDPAEEICELTVQDNGIGFDEKYLDKVFAVFQRLHGRDRYEGTGVGLAVCRRITDRHNGSITARSRPGEGATFVVHLPVRHTTVEQEVAA